MYERIVYLLVPGGKLEVEVRAEEKDFNIQAARISVQRRDTSEPVTTIQMDELVEVRKLLQAVERWLETFNPYTVEVVSLTRIDPDSKH